MNAHIYVLELIKAFVALIVLYTILYCVSHLYTWCMCVDRRLKYANESINDERERVYVVYFHVLNSS